MSASDKSGMWIPGSRGSAYGRKTPGASIKVLIVDDHEGYRQALKTTLDVEPDIQVVGEAGNGHEAITAVEQLRPDVVLMDINMPGMDGMQATRRLVDSYPGILVITLTMYKDEEHLKEARRAGASAYVMKDSGSELLLQTIRDVMSGDTPLLQGAGPVQGETGPTPRQQTSAQPKGPATSYLITSNERTILQMLASGATNDEIAQGMNVPTGMVRTYLFEICRKLGLPDRDAAVEYARTRMKYRPGGAGTDAGLDE